ncbi:MAG: hypothetical protein R2706_17955 [Acidimicrobiales bacterium]
MVATKLRHEPFGGVDRRRFAVDFHEQDGLGVAGISRLNEIFHQLDCVLVHHLDGGGHQAPSDEATDCPGGVGHVVEGGQHGGHGLGIWRDANRMRVATPSIPSPPTTTPRRS